MFIDVPSGQDLPSMIAGVTGLPKRMLALALGLVLGGGTMAWALSHPEGRSSDVLFSGLGIGAVIVSVWWVSGHFGYVSEGPRTLEKAFIATNSNGMEFFSFVAPVAYTLDWLMFFSDASKLLTLGIVATVGVIVGSAAYSLATHGFRWEGFRNAEDTANHLFGAVLMGVGGVTALGCTIGQGPSGVSTLSITSFIALGAIIAGAVAALRVQVWRIERQA